jgi:lauroyl/myristoyl acyltransferase
VANQKLVEPADLLRIPKWVLARPLYAVVPVSVLFRLATLKGAISSVLSQRGLEIRRRVKHVNPGATRSEYRQIARKHMQFAERERLSNLWPCIRRFSGGERINIEGRHHLDDTLRAGRGAIIVTPHFGYARLLKPILLSQGYPALLIGPAHEVRIGGFPPLTRVGRLVRSRVLRLPWPEPEDDLWMRVAGYDLVAQLNLRPHLAALAQNQILISLPEGRGGQALHRVSMMGVDVLMSPTVLSMSRHTGAPILPAFVEDDPGSKDPVRVHLVIERPLALPAHGGGRTSVARDLQSLTDVFESWIRAAPHLWLAWSGPPLAWWGGSLPPVSR